MAGKHKHKFKIMKKLLLIIAVFCTSISNAQVEKFNNQDFHSISFDAVNNLSFKNLNFVTDINNGAKSVSVLSKYDKEGNLTYVGTNDKDFVEANDPNKQCGRACMGCQSDYGCWICFIGCVLFKMEHTGDSDHEAFASLKPGEVVSVEGLNYTEFYSKNIEGAKNSSKMSVYNGEKLISAVNFNFDDNFSIAKILVFFEDPTQANTAFGKCLMDCGINSKTNWGAVLCAWDCLAKYPQTAPLFAY
jgi:hypothetical protein